MSPIIVSAGPNDSFAGLSPFPQGFLDGIIPPGTLPVIEQCWYVDPRGGITDLSTDMDRRFKEGIEGRYMAPIQHLSDSVPGMDGARYRGTRSLPRALSVPMLFLADDTTSARQILRDLSRGINPTKKLNGLPAQGKLYVVTEDGLYRYINCLYEAGLDSNTEPTSTQTTYLYTDVRSVIPVFRAFDPFWYDVEPTIVPISQALDTGTFFPGPPWEIGASDVYSEFIQNNPGDVESWPIWTITGPGKGLKLINVTTDDFLSLSTVIGPTTSVRIDTRPGFKTVTVMNSGANLFPDLDGDLWALDSDDNQIRVEMIGTASTSSVGLEYTPGYQSV